MSTDLPRPADLDGWILGEYLGGGAYGDVFLATRACASGAVETAALKLLRPNDQGELTEADLERFHREASILDIFRRMGHELDGMPCPRLIGPGAVPVRGDRRWMLVMELSGGQSLGRLQREGGLSQREVLNAVLEVTVGLEKLHMLGICHRDLKPDNILWSPVTRTVSLIDWGSGALPKHDGLTERMGAVPTTPAYAPTWSVQPGTPLRHAQWDAYAVIMTLWRLLTNTAPPQRRSELILSAVASNEVRLLVERALAASEAADARACPSLAEIRASILHTQAAAAGIDPMSLRGPARPPPVEPPDGPSVEPVRPEPGLEDELTVPVPEPVARGRWRWGLGAALVLLGVALAWGLTRPGDAGPPVVLPAPSAPTVTAPVIPPAPTVAPSPPAQQAVAPPSLPPVVPPTAIVAPGSAAPAAVAPQTATPSAAPVVPPPTGLVNPSATEVIPTKVSQWAKDPTTRPDVTTQSGLVEALDELSRHPGPEAKEVSRLVWEDLRGGVSSVSEATTMLSGHRVATLQKLVTLTGADTGTTLAAGLMKTAETKVSKGELKVTDCARIEPWVRITSTTSPKEPWFTAACAACGARPSWGTMCGL